MLLLAPAAAAADDVGCGDTVVTDTTLTHDLLGCPGPGLVIGAPGITLDLAGHTVAGSGVAAGIDNRAGHDDVRVVGFGPEGEATVRDFRRGIHLVGADDNRVQFVDLIGDEVGFDARNSERIDLLDSFAAGNVAVRLVGSHGSGLLSMVVDGRRLDVDLRGSRTTLDELFAGPGGIAVRGNDNTIVTSWIDGRRGIRVAGNRNWIVDTEVLNTAANGIWIESGRGNLVDFNFAAGNAGDGILVGSRARDTRVHGNSTHGNGDDGIDVNGPRATIGDNTANENGDLGIEARAGAIDAGGNQAARNGNPAECIGVVCT